MPGPDGKVGHAELTIGDSVIMLADEFPDMGARGPRSVGGSPVTIHVYVENVDATFDQAISAGATVLRPVESIATHIEDLSPEKMQKRMGEIPG